MRISRIEFEGHEIFGDLSIDLTDRETGKAVDTVIVAGESGVGKTRLLEEIYNITVGDKMPYTRGKTIAECELSNEDGAKFAASAHECLHRDYEEARKLIITKDYSRKPPSYCDVEVFVDGSLVGQHTNNPVLNYSDAARIFATRYSSAEIAYPSCTVRSITSLDMDRPVTEHEKGGQEVASHIKQLFVDIANNDAQDLNKWVRDNPGLVPPDNVVDVRINRFRNAFSTMFGDDFTLDGIATTNGEQVIMFRKGDRSLRLEDLSSGEMQIIFRGAFFLKDQKSMTGRLALIDEPELSLHPRWQKGILEYYRHLFCDESGNQLSQLFVVTHSPFVVFSETRHDDKVIVLERVGGKICMARDPEFYRCGSSEAVEDAFKVSDFTKTQTPTVYVEGQTDVRYLNRAIELFRDPATVGYIVKQVGCPDNGGARGSGKDAMSKLWSVSTQAVPDRFAGNAMVLLYDCDVSNVENDDCGDVHRRRMDRNPRNEIITVGIENLLEFPSGFSLKEYYCKRESVRGDGGRCMNEYLDKSRLCDDIVAFSDDEAKVVLARLENELKKIETALSLD